MKGNHKKTLGLILSTLMIVTSFVGCKNKTEAPAPNGKQTNATTDAAKSNEPVKIRLMNRINADVKVDDNPYFKEIEKLANVKLEIEAPPINNYNDRLQIVMASGDLPDVIYIWNLDQNYERWASDGLFQPLDDKVGKYANLNANITKEMWEVARATTTGKIHGVPKANKVNRWGYLANQQWLDKLGVKPPTNVDELYSVGKDIAAKDPDGNGKADTFAISPFGLWNDIWLTSAFNLAYAKGAADIDGNFKVRERFEGYVPYLTYMRKLYTEKVLDPEFFMNKIYNDKDKVLQNRVAFFHGHDTNLVNIVQEAPDALKRFAFYPILANQKGQVVNGATPAVWGAWTISNGVKNVDGVLKFLDWGNSKEGFNFMNIGVKGTHYNDYDAEKRLLNRTPEQLAKAKADFSSYTALAYALKGVIAVPGDTAEKVERYNKDMDNYFKKAKEVNIPAVKAPKLDLFGAENPDLIKKRDEMEIKYVIGEINLDAFKTFIDKEYLPKIADAEKEYVEIMKKIK
jgi:putative aldouronate transport system substrate-binding protein